MKIRSINKKAGLLQFHFRQKMSLCKMVKEDRSVALSRDVLNNFSVLIKDKTVLRARKQAIAFFTSIVSPLRLKFYLFKTHNRRNY